MSSAERIAARFSMRGRRALVTGGSVSIGRAIVLAFADAGAEIAIQYAPAADSSMGTQANSRAPSLIRACGTSWFRPISRFRVKVRGRSRPRRRRWGQSTC
jgi:NAD(P)-dependent dehydrogenase (short-subunit alcohol dehydrogenase family)